MVGNKSEVAAHQDQGEVREFYGRKGKERKYKEIISWTSTHQDQSPIAVSVFTHTHVSNVCGWLWISIIFLVFWVMKSTYWLWREIIRGEGGPQKSTTQPPAHKLLRQYGAMCPAVWNTLRTFFTLLSPYSSLYSYNIGRYYRVLGNGFYDGRSA